jgi:sulfur carrier protein ThiS
MRVKVVAPFPISNIQADNEVEVPDRCTVGSLLRRLNPPVYGYLLPVLVNGIQAKYKTRLKPGDLIVILLPMSGG